MTVAVCTMGCGRKAKDGFPSWPYLFDLDGDYSLYVNYECQNEYGGSLHFGHEGHDLYAKLIAEHPSSNAYFDEWWWQTTSAPKWRSLPKFDQDQSRLASIVIARNMCVEYAMQTNASYLLFVDADIIPPRNIIPKLLELNHDATCGLVHGRGVHANATYLFGEKRRWQQGDPQYTVVECEHCNIGFTMISRRLFEAVRFRYGMTMYEDGRNHLTSDDPAFHADCYLKFKEWPWLRMDVEGQHVGELRAEDVSQF